MKKRNLQIQVRMQIFRKMSQNALNRVLTVPKESSQQMQPIPLKIMDFENIWFSIMQKHWKFRILVPMSYITFFDEWRSSCRRTRSGGRLWRCPLICSLFTHLRQVDLRSTCKSTSSAQASVLTHYKRDVAISRRFQIRCVFGLNLESRWVFLMIEMLIFL